MRIAVVGSGNPGGALGQRVAAAGHTVISSYSQVPAKLEPVAPEVTPDKFERMSRNEAERTRLAQ
jgi:predicted dinucleotide-binding enzyme